MSRWESQARQRERRLAELEQQLLDKSAKLENLRHQLDESSRQLSFTQRHLGESQQQREEAEQTLSIRLQACTEELTRQAATPPRVKVSSGRAETQHYKTNKTPSNKIKETYLAMCKDG